MQLTCRRLHAPHLANTNCSARGGALRITALLICGGFTPSGTRYTPPIHSRYEMHLDTPSLGTGRKVDSLLSHVRRNELNMRHKTESADGVF